MYSSKQEFKNAALAMKKIVNKKENKKNIMNATKGWDYGKHPQENKKCKLGVQSVFQRLCSQTIRDNMKIPPQSDLHFCVFGKGNNCCNPFKWINQLFSTNHQPYFQFNLYKSIIDSLSPPNSALDHNHHSFLKNAVWTKLNECSYSTKLIVTINGGEIKQSFYLKEIGRDTMTKNFDIHQINCRTSYVPQNQKIAIQIQNDIFMVLSGGIVGTGFCNLVKEEKKCKDDCYSIIHLLQEHKEEVDIKFFVKDGFDGTINVSLYNSGYTALLAKSTKHESTDSNHNNYETKEEYNSMSQQQPQSSIFGRFDDSVDPIRRQTMKPLTSNTQHTAQDNYRSTPSVCHSQNESISAELPLNIIPQPSQQPVIPSTNNCIQHNSHDENNQHTINNNNSNYGGHHTSFHCSDGRHSPYNQQQNPFPHTNHHNHNNNITHIALPQINETQPVTNNYNNEQYLNQNTSNNNNLQYNNNNNNNDNNCNNSNNCFADVDGAPSQSGYPCGTPFPQQQFDQHSSNEFTSNFEMEANTKDYVQGNNNNNYSLNHNHDITYNNNNNCFAEDFPYSTTPSQYNHSHQNNDYLHTNNLNETGQQQLPQYPQPMQNETDTNAIKDFGAEHKLDMDITNHINNNNTMFETDTFIGNSWPNNLASPNVTDYGCYSTNDRSLCMLNNSMDLIYDNW